MVCWFFFQLFREGSPSYPSSPPSSSFLTLSRDSSCEDDLYSASLGFEMSELRPEPPPAPPDMTEKGNCSFPSWLQGEWRDLSVNGRVAIYRDRSPAMDSSESSGGGEAILLPRTFTSHCIQQSPRHADFRYLIYSRSQW